MAKPKILLINCSIRAKATRKEIIEEINFKDEDSMKEHIERALRAKKVSNSERGLMTATFGLKQYPVKLDYIKLADYFLPDGTNKNIGNLIKKIQQADGIIFSTPVYFGACTSLLEELRGIIKEKEIDLFPKVITFISVGAKRNGGQEATIIFSAWDWMELGVIVHNEGYPRSQFGGICVAGSIGHSIEDDSWGVMTCIALGKRIAQTALILKAGDLKEKIRITFWKMEDKSYILPPEWNISDSEIKYLELHKMNFHRCLGCQVCPSTRDENTDYRCFKKDDDIHKIHNELVGGEAIVPIGYDLRFHERTRYLRRDNYRLTYHIVFMPQPKYIPIFIKENSILCRNHLVEYAKLIKSGRKKVKTEIQIYEPIGHERIY